MSSRDGMTNRDRLKRIAADLAEIANDEAISATPHEYLLDARILVRRCFAYPLDTAERSPLARLPHPDPDTIVTDA